MPNRQLVITVKGKQGSGKTHVVQILKKALLESGYLCTHLDASPTEEDRHILWDGFHTIGIESRQEETGEEVTNG